MSEKVYEIIFRGRHDGAWETHGLGDLIEVLNAIDPDKFDMKPPPYADMFETYTMKFTIKKPSEGGK